MPEAETKNKKEILAELLGEYFGDKCSYNTDLKSYSLNHNQIFTSLRADQNFNIREYKRATAYGTFGGETPGYEKDSVYAVKFASTEKMIGKVAKLCMENNQVNKENMLKLISKYGIKLKEHDVFVSKTVGGIALGKN